MPALLWHGSYLRLLRPLPGVLSYNLPCLVVSLAQTLSNKNTALLCTLFTEACNTRYTRNLLPVQCKLLRYALHFVSNNFFIKKLKPNSLFSILRLPRLPSNNSRQLFYKSQFYFGSTLFFNSVDTKSTVT
jgi:hypothetical protein